jgi:DNA adenine methylase
MKGKAAVTVNDIPAMRQAFDGLTMKSLNIRYTLSKVGTGRRERGELLVMNYKPGRC